MVAYVLFMREGPVRDAEEMAKYSQATRANPPDPKLTPLVVYGAMEVLEGQPPDGVVMLQFPTMEDAKAWYHSPGYQAAAVHRKLGADYRAVIIQGL
jgi:uncharacterized protein (DUF1330 family)